MARASTALAMVIFAFLFAEYGAAKTIVVPWGLRSTRLPPVGAVCGDTLSFAAGGNHDIVQVAAGNCGAATIKTLFAAPAPTTSNVLLTATGKTFYKCSIGSHCSSFFMLVNVTTAGPCPPPPKPAPVTIPVAWTQRTTAFPTVNARCGDSIKFNIAGGFHSVIKVSAGTCSAPKLSTIAAAPAATTTVKLTAVGTTFYKCDVGNHCASGKMLLTVNTAGPC